MYAEIHTSRGHESDGDRRQASTASLKMKVLPASQTRKHPLIEIVGATASIEPTGRGDETVEISRSLTIQIGAKDLKKILQFAVENNVLRFDD